MKPEIGRSIIASRLLILQSKRLVMNSCQRRFNEGGHDTLRDRIERLRAETDTAQYSYRSAILAWAPPEHSDYWLIAYGRMIDKGHAIVSKMRSDARILPPSERFKVAAEVDTMERMIKGWTESMRQQMTGAVA